MGRQSETWIARRSGENLGLDFLRDQLERRGRGL